MATGRPAGDRTPFVPSRMDLCSSEQKQLRAYRLQQEQQLRVLRRRTSAPQAHGAHEDEEEAPVDLGKLAVCTTIYSLVEGVVTYPYDLVKTRQQAAPPGSRVTQLPTTAYVHDIIQKEGAHSLYRGFSWNVLGGVPSEVAYYAMYTWSKHTMQRTHLGQEYPSAVYACAGLLSDVVGVLFWVPADVISQRMQLQGVASNGDGVAGCSERGAVPAAPLRPTATGSALSQARGLAGWWQATVQGWLRTALLTAEVADAAVTSATAAASSPAALFAAPQPVAAASKSVPFQVAAAEHASVKRRKLHRSWAGVSSAPRIPAASRASAASPSRFGLRLPRTKLCFARRSAISGGSAASAASTSASAPPAPAPLSGMQIAQRILQREGVPGLWRGTTATMLALAPNSAVWWLTHEECKSRFAKKLGLPEESPTLLSLSGAMAGITSTIATNPVDVLKTRLQCSEERGLSLRRVLSGVLGEAGWRGLYSGLIPRLAAAVPRSICAVLFYEQSIALCRRTAADTEEPSQSSWWKPP
jgi:hypothetical protein